MRRFIGAVCGDIIGSVFEFNNYKHKDGYPLFCKKSEFTDDSVMTLAIADALMKCDEYGYDVPTVTVDSMQGIGRNYPYCGYGGMFYRWMFSDDPMPYNSFGNGSAMRIAAVPYVAKTEEEVKKLAYEVTAVSHNHSEGIKGAECTAIATFMALHGATKEEICDRIERDYYKLDETCDEIRPWYYHDETCQLTMPQAMECFKESTSYEDCIRTVISIGGDTDTIGAIAGAVAGAYYGVPEEIAKKAETYLDERLLKILKEFERKYDK